MTNKKASLNRSYHSSDINDAALRRILIQRRKKKMIKRVIKRVTLLIAGLLVIIALLVSSIKHFLPDGNNPIDSFKYPNGVIFIDAGHGGDDPGAEYGKRTEKEDTLKMAQSIKSALNARGYYVKMSRTKDITVGRINRGKMANKANAKFMISIHRNKASFGQGVEMWIPAANGKKDRMLGENIMMYMEEVGVSENRGVRSGTLADPKDDYYENSVPTMPSVLIEFGFMNDKEDNRLFDKNLKRYGEAVAKGIEKTDKKINGK